MAPAMDTWMVDLFNDHEVLLAETRALRGLAQSLVGDAHSAEDLVQGTWLTALGRRPRSLSRSWLRGILRNVLRQERRSSARRARRERAVARQELQDEDLNLERLEILEAVVAAVRSLPEPYRGTVMARFFEGESPDRIGKRLGVPTATVRTRLHRAVGMLRETLDRRSGGDRESWRRALLFIVSETVVPSLVMSSKIKLAAAVLAVLGLIWSLSVLSVAEPAVPGAPPSLPDPAGITAAEDIRREKAEQMDGGAATERVALPEPSVGAAGSGSSDMLSITGVVEDDAGDPLAGARVWMSRWEARSGPDGAYTLRVPRNRTAGFVHAEARGYTAHRGVFEINGLGPVVQVDFALRREFRIGGRITDADGEPVEGAEVDTFFNRGAPARSDANGEYLLAGLDPGRPSHMLNALKPGYVRATAIVQTSGGEADQDLVLDRGNEVLGTVVGPGGAAVVGAYVYLGFDPNAYDRLEGETDDAGAFRFPAVHTGTETIVVQHEDFAPVSRLIRIPARPDPLPPLRIELESGRTVTGRVVDGTGRPIPGALIGAYHKGKRIRRRTGSDQEGRFRLAHLPEEELSLSASGEGYLRLSGHRVPTGVLDTEIVLLRTGQIAGRVVNGHDGSPVTSFTVRLVPPRLEAGDRRTMSYAATWAREGHGFTDPDGRWSTGNERLDPGSVIGLEFRAEGFAPQVIDRALVRIEPDPDAFVVELYRGTRVYGQVVAADGRGPVPGARITVLRGDRKLEEGDSDDTHDRLLTHADSSGSFELRGLGHGEIHLAVEHPGWAFEMHGPVSLAPGQLEQETRVELTPGLVLSGQLRDAAGRPRPGVEVELRSVEVEGLSNRGWHTRTDAQGRYRFERLPAGVFSICDRVGDELASRTIGRHVRLAPPGPVLADLEASPGGGEITGRIRAEVALDRVLVRLEPLDGLDLPWRQRPVERRALAESGVFRFSNVPAGRYRVSVDHRASSVVLEGSLELVLTAGGRQEVLLELKPR